MNFIVLLGGLIFHFSNIPKHFIFPISHSKSSSLNIPNSNKFMDYKYYVKNHYHNGFDERYHYKIYEEPDANTELMHIRETYTKLKLLQLLENPEIGVPVKIEAIKEHNFIYKKSPFSTDISAGGLMDEWNFDLDP
uniref:Uncharacterized protein n=1 Tax=viral metagenome TaxID=1070528 RepID=A0A6C0HAG4_9ZZZZ